MADFSISQVTSVYVERTRSNATAWTSIKVATARGEVHEIILFSASDQPVSIPIAVTRNEPERALPAQPTPETEGSPEPFVRKGGEGWYAVFPMKGNEHSGPWRNRAAADAALREDYDEANRLELL